MGKIKSGETENERGEQRAIMVKEPTARAFERHAQTIIGGMIFAVAAWVGITLVNLNAEAARQTDVTELSKIINNQSVTIARIEARLNEQIDDRYRAAQARADFALRDQRLTALEAVVEALRLTVEKQRGYAK